MSTQPFLSTLENRLAVKSIVEQVLAQVEPEELTIAGGLIDPLIDMAGEGEVARVDHTHEAGGLGGIDLVALVVVPIVVSVIGNLITELGKAWIEEWKRKRQQNPREAQEVIKVKMEQVEAIVKQTGSVRGKKRIKELKQAIDVAVLAYLEQK